MECSRIFILINCICFFCHRIRKVQTACWNITFCLCSIIILISNPAPYSINCSRLFHFIQLKNFPYFFPIFPAWIIQYRSITFYFNIFICRLNLIRITEHLILNVSNNFAFIYFTGYFAPSIITDCTSLQCITQCNVPHFFAGLAWF